MFLATVESGPLSLPTVGVFLLPACYSTVVDESPTDSVTMDSADTSTRETGEPSGMLAPIIQGDSDEIFDDDRVLVFEFRLDDDSWQALLDQPREYAAATFIWEGQAYGPIGIRTKGNSSWLPIDEKASLKVKFDEYDPDGEFFGMHKLTLNNMSQDPSMMHERSAYRIFREAAVPSPRCNHARVILNGESYGLYANVETTDRKLVERWFANDQGTLFELTDVDFRDEYIADFELEFGDDDRSTLQAVADALENADPEAAMEEASTWVDMDNYLRYWGVVAYIAHLDGYPYADPGDDTHVYDDPDTGRLFFIPHGTDESFVNSDDWIEHGIHGVLGETCMEVSACKEGFRQQLSEILDLADSMDLLDYSTTVQEQIAPEVEADSHRPYNMEAVDQFQAAMLEMIQNRRATLEEQGICNKTRRKGLSSKSTGNAH